MVFDDGSLDYPVSMNQAFTIVANSMNTGSTTYNAIVVNVKAYTYTGLFTCSWVEIPTFGLL